MVINDAEKMAKKINDTNKTEVLKSIQKTKEDIMKFKAKKASLSKKSLFAKIKPDTPAKKVIWATVAISLAAGAFIYFKKRN